MIGIIPVIGVLCTLLLLFWFYPRQMKTGKLADLYSVDAARSMAGLKQNIPIPPFSVFLCCPFCHSGHDDDAASLLYPALVGKYRRIRIPDRQTLQDVGTYIIMIQAALQMGIL